MRRRTFISLAVAASLVLILFASEVVSDEITVCDRLASDQYDLMRTAPSVPDGEFKATDAERACRQSLQQFPSSPKIQFQLARALFELGRTEEAAKFAEQAAKQAYPSAYYLLGILHQQNSRMPQYSIESAISYFLKAGEAGHVPAAVKLYEAYLFGYGVEKNLHNAEKWISHAANAGDPDAIYLYAVYLDQIVSTATSSAKALSLLEESAKTGNPIARFRYGSYLFLSNDHEKSQLGLSFLKDLIEKQTLPQQLHFESYFYLGMAFEMGIGVEKNLEKSISYYREAYKVINKKTLQIKIEYLTKEKNKNTPHHPTKNPAQ